MGAKFSALVERMKLSEEGKLIFLETLNAINLRTLLNNRILIKDDELKFDSKTIDLKLFERFLIIGFGKAGVEMGSAIEAIFKSRSTTGVIVTNRVVSKSLACEIIISSHPLPDQNSLLAAKKIIDLINRASEKTLIIFLISGGGSSLVELPVEGISLDDLRDLNRLLVNSGATIAEINQVRKYLSQIKGGKLAGVLKKRKALAIYLSDVNHGDVASIASGPLIPDSISQGDVLSILKKYKLEKKIPKPVLTVLKHQPSADLSTQRSHIEHFILLENREVIAIAAQRARERGFRVEIYPDLVNEDYRKIADHLIIQLIKLQKKYPSEKVALIGGGEVNCQVKSKGIGGRNQEFVLYSASRFAAKRLPIDAAFLAMGTDGIDGNSIADGAVLGSLKPGFSEQTFLINNDSHSLIKKIGGLLVTGPSGNNVRDLYIFLASPEGWISD
ncbi:MAG: DUF4147 domain-containing protein [Acidobacteriota bacterium]